MPTTFGEKFTLIAVVTILTGMVMWVMFICATLAQGGSERGSYETYSAWRKINPSYEITYEEWGRLLRADMLPRYTIKEESK